MDGDGICDSGLFYEDDISITITSEKKPYLPENYTASNLRITGYTVNFTPLENSPPVPSKQIYHDVILAPGSSVDMPIRVIDQGDKNDITSPLYYANLCTNSPDDCMYEYTVTVIIKAVEMLTGVKHLLTVGFPLHYFDLETDEDDDCI